MSGRPPVSPRPELPEEFKFLCMLHNVGATNVERSLTVDEITKWTDQEASIILEYLQKLAELGYVEFIKRNEVDRYHVSVIGIRKVLTLYS